MPYSNLRTRLIFVCTIIFTFLFINNCIPTDKSTSETLETIPNRIIISTPLYTSSSVITQTSTSKLTQTTVSPTEAFSSLTPLPTIPTSEANIYIANLLLHNAGCKLPCWWGIEPGKTTWERTHQFLQSFISPINNFKEDIVISDQLYHIDAHCFSYQLDIRNGEGHICFFIKEDIIERITIYSYGTELSYQLNQLLSEYGIPDEVLLQGWPYNDDREPYFALLVIYNNGIMARYEGKAPFMSESSLQICVKGSAPEFVLWSPEMKVPQDFLGSRAYNKWDAPPFRPIQEVTQMDNKTFFETMQNPHACFETPLRYWDYSEYELTITPSPP